MEILQKNDEFATVSGDEKRKNLVQQLKRFTLVFSRIERGACYSLVLFNYQVTGALIERGLYEEE